MSAHGRQGQGGEGLQREGGLNGRARSEARLVQPVTVHRAEHTGAHWSTGHSRAQQRRIARRTERFLATMLAASYEEPYSCYTRPTADTPQSGVSSSAHDRRPGGSSNFEGKG